MAFRENRLNLYFGLSLTILISIPPLGLLSNELRRPVFYPDNTWLWIALLGLVPLGIAVAAIGLSRRIRCFYFIWSQLVLSVIVSVAYVGWYRRVLDYANMGPDPEALDQGPPCATAAGFMILLFTWLAVGLAPLAIRGLIRWIRARRSPAMADKPHSLKAGG